MMCYHALIYLTAARYSIRSLLPSMNDLLKTTDEHLHRIEYAAHVPYIFPAQLHPAQLYLVQCGNHNARCKREFCSVYRDFYISVSMVFASLVTVLLKFLVYFVND